MDRPAKRRFRFSLRSLLVVVVVCAIPVRFVAYQLVWIQQRQKFMAAHGQRTLGSSQSPQTPTFLSYFGEEGVSAWDATGWTDVEIWEAKQLFPESDIVPHPANKREPGGA